MSNIAEETLIKQRQKLIDEREKFLSQIDAEISELSRSIEIISGKKPNQWTSAADLYDDEHPNYIKGSQEEI
jgi:hypothetical protein